MRFFLLLLFLAIAPLAFAQNQLLDSLYKRVQDHPKQDTLRVVFLNELSLRIFKNQPDKSFRYAQEALLLAQRLAFLRGIGEAQNNLAVYHLMKGNAGVALQLGLEAIKIGERAHQAALLASSYSTVGTIYHNQLSYDKALYYLSLAQKLNQPVNNALVASKILNALGSIARDKEKYDSALIFYEKALLVMRDGKEEYRLPEVLNNIGVVYQRQNKRDLAMEYYFKALKAAEKSENKRGKALTLANIGNTFLSERKYKEAKEYLLQSLLLSKETGNKKSLSSGYMAMMQLENELGEFDEAHKYMVSYYDLKDSLLNAEKTRQIAELEIRFETEKKELAIQLLEHQNNIQQLKTNILVGMFIILTIASVVIYLLQRSRDKKNRHILNLEIDYLTSQHKELSEKFKNVLTGGDKTIESLDQRILRKAIEVVENNISDPLFGVERFGREMGMSRTNLHRKMKAIAGFPPSELIRSIRLRKAAALLLSQADSVSQISFAVGFEDQSYFSKSFKKQFGVPPSEYLGSIGQSAN